LVFYPFLALSAGFLVLGALLGLLVQYQGAVAFTRFKTEIPNFGVRLDRDVYSPLITAGSLRYFFGFILGREFEHYPISDALRFRYTRIRSRAIASLVASAIGATFLIAGPLIAIPWPIR
jgi:hypothetical protein